MVCFEKVTLNRFPFLATFVFCLGSEVSNKCWWAKTVSHPSTAQWLAQQALHLPDSGSKGQRGRWQKNKMSTGCQDSSLGLSCVHPKVCTCFRHSWGKTTMECARWESKELFWKRLRWRVSCSKEWATGWSWLSLGTMTWPHLPPGSMQCDPVHTLDVCNIMVLGLKASGGQCLHYVPFPAEGAHWNLHGTLRIQVVSTGKPSQSMNLIRVHVL